MIVNIKDITSAIGKIKELTNGDKVIPGVLLVANGDELNVCYSDGRKSMIEKIPVVQEESDPGSEVVLDFSRFDSAIGNCQPSGRIIVDDVGLQFSNDGHKIMEIVAEQKYSTGDLNEIGEEELKVLSVKEMKLNWSEAGDSMRTAILTRMKYETIFECSSPDKWLAGELADILSKTSVEKGRIVYMSPKIQKVFVTNRAYATSVPIEMEEVSEEDIEAVKAEYPNEEDADKVEAAIEALGKKMKHPVTLSTASAKQICSILSKLDKQEEVFTYVEGAFFGMFNSDETIGIFVEMTQGNKTHTSTFGVYDSMPFGTYQLTFAREFVTDSIKTAIATTNSEKLTMKFEKNEEETVLVIEASDVNASVEDTYRVVADDCIDSVGDIENVKLTVSLKVVYDMMAQLKEDMMAFDIEVKPDKTRVLRVADIDMEKLSQEYYKAREALGLTDIDPTPAEEKVKYRVNTLGTRQYTMLG